MNDIDVTGAYFEGYREVATEYFKWVEALKTSVRIKGTMSPGSVLSRSALASA